MINQEAELIKKVVNESQSYIYVVEPDTYKIIYANKQMGILTGKDPNKSYGDSCYHFIKGLDKPCEQCFIKTAKYNEINTRVFTSDKTGKSYVCKGKLFKLNNVEYFVEYLTDETEKINQQKNLEDMLNNIPGGVGVYNYYLNGKLEQVYLNDGYYSLIGTTRKEREKYHGFSVTEAIFPDDIDLLMETIKKCVESNSPISVDIRISTITGKYKWFNIKASISKKENNKVILYAVYSDIDELKNAHLTLEMSRKAISIASENRGLTFWLYYLDEKRIIQKYIDNSPLGDQKIIDNVPEYFLNSKMIFEPDKDKFAALYEDMFSGKMSSECTIRTLNNNTNRYEWKKMAYQRLDDKMYGKKVAIGFSGNAEAEQEMIEKYDNELKLRTELIKNALFYYKLNLTTGVFEEYQTKVMRNIPIDYGVKTSETIRKTILDQVYIDDRDKVENNLFSPALKKMYDNGISTNEMVYRRKINEADIRYIKVNVSITETPANHDLIAFIYCFDIDDEMKSKLTLDNVVEREIDSVLLLNIKSNKARVINKKKEYGTLSINDVIDFYELVKDSIDREVYIEDVKVCKKFFFEELLNNKENKEKEVLTFRVVDTNNNILRKMVRVFYLDETHNDIVLVKRDITDLYEEEQKQKRELEQAINEANEANNAKSEFLSRMSHDIRTPLTSIIALSSDEMINNINEEQKNDYLKKINTSSNYLLGLVNDVLDMSKIESRKMVLMKDRYTFLEFKNNIYTMISDSCKKKNIEFLMNVQDDHQRCVLTDKIRLNQVMLNLLSNAIKFTPNGGKIWFTIKHLGIDDNMVKKRFIVKDNGVGMKPEFVNKCFDTFVQENQSKHITTEQGTGLGLSIAKELVEIMKGTITVESTLGKGTVFTIDLSFELAPEDKTIGAIVVNESETKLEGIHILLCEDNLINSEIIKNILMNKKCLVDIAYNGKEGLEDFVKSSEYYYDIILMDIRMPIMNGIEATKAIRLLERKDAKTIPIIALTADAFNEEYQSTKDAGMTTRLTKPIDTSLLFKTIIDNLK